MVEWRYRASDKDCSTCLSAIILSVGILWACVSGSNRSAMCTGMAASRVLPVVRLNGRARVRISCEFTHRAHKCPLELIVDVFLPCTWGCTLIMGGAALRRSYRLISHILFRGSDLVTTLSTCAFGLRAPDKS